MDLDQLLFQHTRALTEYSLHPAQDLPAWTGEGSRFDLIGHYARRIDRLRRRLGAPRYPEWVAGREFAVRSGTGDGLGA